MVKSDYESPDLDANEAYLLNGTESMELEDGVMDEANGMMLAEEDVWAI